MRYLFMALLMVCLFVPQAAYAASKIVFDGRVYTRQAVDRTDIMTQAEYTQGRETLENWTKLIAVRHFPNVADPKEMAAKLVDVLYAQNPEAKHEMVILEDGNDVLMDFITWPSNKTYLEFNVHRYRKVEGYKGLISYQFAYRFTHTTPKFLKQFIQNKESWKKLMMDVAFPIDFE